MACFRPRPPLLEPGGRLRHLRHHLAGGVALHAFVGQGRPGDVAAQLFQRLAVICGATHGGVQGEAGHKGPEGALCLPNARRRYKPSG